YLAVQYRSHDLHTAPQVTGSKIGRPNKIVVVAAVPEMKDSLVLQKAPQHATDAYSLRKAGHARPEDTEPSNHEVDFHSSVGRPVEPADDIGVFETVDLCADSASASGLGVGDFPIDPLQKARDGVTRRHQQPPKRDGRGPG